MMRSLPVRQRPLRTAPWGAAGRWLLAALPWAGRIAAWLALCTPAAFAQTLADHEHTVWTERQGLAAEVFSITQVPSGMLRIRTTVGNQVFDGVSFHSPSRAPGGGPFVDPADLVGQLSPTGAVYYVHPDTLRLMRRFQGHTTAVDDPDGIGWWTRFVFDSRGIGWYFKEGGVFRLEGDQVRALDDSWGLPKGLHASYRPVIDAQDTVWFANPDRLYRLPRDARRFEPVEVAGCERVATAPDGGLWCAGPRGLAVITLKDGRLIQHRVLSTQAFGPMLFDSRGGFWIRSSAGLAHAARWQDVLAPGGVQALLADSMTPAHGLASLSINMIFEDGDGNVWLGTATSLERFRPPRFQRAALPAYAGAAHFRPDPAGGFWVGPDSGPLMHVEAGAGPVARVLFPQIRDVATLQYGPGGRLWVATRNALWRKDVGAAFEQVEAPDLSQRGRIHQVAEDDTGAIWLQAGYHLLRLHRGQLAPFDGPQAPPSDGRYVMVHDAQGQLWFFPNERQGPYVLRKGVFRSLDNKAFAQTMAQSWVAAVHGRRVWVGGRTGVGVFEDDEFRPLKTQGDALKAITGIVQTPQGELWLFSLSKLFRLTAAQVAAGLRGEPVEPEIFDSADGLRGTNDRLYASTLTEAPKGRVWVSTNEGVFGIDPQHARRDPPPPITMIEGLRSDAEIRERDLGVQLSPSPGRVQIRYAAAALSGGDEVRFRHRIVGLDTQWQDVGPRRTADYTQLPPGRHRFEVQARVANGPWAPTPSALVIEVEPAWYQTWWCRLLWGVLALSGLWWLHRVRLNVLRRREELRMRAMLAERERIARDLHDTLLQSMQGLILDFQGVASTLPEHDATRRSMESRLDQADLLLGEARDRVRGLRDDHSGVCLRAAFDSAAAQLAGTVDITVEERGRVRDLRPDAKDLMYLIGREALVNAVAHGKGSRIVVRMEFWAQGFVMQIQDHGPGIPSEVLAAGGRPGHFGLLGMRERAAQLGAEILIVNQPQGGCLVKLHVPAERVYAAGQGRRFWTRWRQLLNRLWTSAR